MQRLSFRYPSVGTPPMQVARKAAAAIIGRPVTIELIDGWPPFTGTVVAAEPIEDGHALWITVDGPTP